MKRIISILLSTFIVLSLFVGTNINVSVANAQTGDELAYPEAPLFLGDIDSNYVGFELVSETDNLALYVIESTVNIAVLNKKTGMIWSSLVTEERILADGEKVTESRFYSILSVEDLSASTGGAGSSALSESFSGSIINITDKEDTSNMTIDYASVLNGIRVIVYFGGNQKYTVAIDISLDPVHETLVLSFQGDKDAYKSPSKKWITICLLPYFGAGSDREDGYVFYPDGSGTIAEFTPHHSATEASKLIPFYSPELASYLRLMQAEMDETMPALYPVFGMKRGNEAFCAIVTDAACSSGVEFCPSGNLTKFYRVYPVFYLMESHARKNDLTTVSYTWTGQIHFEYYRVEYHFLDGEDANYSGMAVTYREYLLENDLLNDAIADGDKMPLALNLFMNTYESSVLGDKTVVMTTFDQACDMITELHDRGIEDMLLNISSWQKNGNPIGDVVPAASAIGGTNGLKNLASLVKEYGYEIFMQVNMEMADSKTTKFKASRDAAKDLEDLAIYQGNVYLIAPPAIKTRYEDIYYEYFKDIDISGLNHAKLGYFLYYYKYDGTQYSRFISEKLITEILAQTRKDFGKNAIWYGNQYSLKYADWIYDLPSTDTGYANTTREVPFAQIVLHGYIPYSAVAGNMFYDDAQQTLKWIEYGYIPYYYLTNESSSNIQNSILFSSKFSDWVDSIENKYKMMSDSVGYLYSVPIKRHEMLATNVFVTIYDDGSKVYVNYGQSDYTTSDGVVKAEDYLVVKG